LFLVMGALLAVVGALCNVSTISLLRLSDRLSKLSTLTRAAVMASIVGLVGWFAPALVGGGDELTQATNNPCTDLAPTPASAGRGMAV
jgi:chloride channel protein, CIC family